MKKITIPLILILVCLLSGYGAGCLIANIMNNSKEKGYVGPQEVRITDGKLTPEAMISLGRLSDPQMSPDGKKILYGVSYASIKDNRSCRNLFVCNADGSGAQQLTRYAGSVSCARWSKDGGSIWFIQDGQLHKADIKFGRKARLSKKACFSDVPAGISEFKLSPDESSILYISSIKNPLVDRPADIDSTLDKADAYVTEDLMYRHWDHWVTDIPRSFVSTLGNGKISPETSLDLLGNEPYELPTEPFGGIEQLNWHPDGRHIVYSCRKHTGLQYSFSTNTSIYVYDILTGGTVAVTTDGGYDTNPVWSPDGSRLAWISMERDGYEADRQRLMVADVKTVECEDGQCFGLEISAPQELSADFIYDVADICWTPAGDAIIFPSTMDAVGALCIAHVSDGKSGIERLTPEDWWKSFGTPFAGDANTLYTTVQSMEQPSEICRIDFSDGSASISALTHTNDAVLEQLGKIKTESITIPTPQGESLHCWVLYPEGFHPDSTGFKGIEMFNGGPQSSLDQSWSYRWNFFLMAQRGYVVVLPNRHGDSGFGQPWKEQISGDYQGLNMQDYILAAKWFKSQPWAGKLAGVGASYGGFSVYNMMSLHDGLFDCFISHAGIFDEKMMWYTTEEAWFGNWDNGGLKEFAYEEGSVGPKGDGITFGGLQQAGAPYADVAKSRHHYENDPESRVTKWDRPVLCMHGMLDFRIPYTQGMAAFNAARMMGLPARLVIFPQECHWINQPQNALLWHEEFYKWLERWM